LLFAEERFLQRFIQLLGLPGTQSHHLGESLLAGIDYVAQVAKGVQQGGSISLVHRLDVGESSE